MNFEGMMMMMLMMMPNALHYTENVQRHANLCVFTDWCFYTVFVRKIGCKDRTSTNIIKVKHCVVLGDLAGRVN